MCKTARLLEAGWRTSVPALLYDYWLLLDHGCHGDVLVGNLQRLRSNESYNDVQFSLRDGTVHANSVIMSMGSDYFATMISNEKFIEGQTDPIVMKNTGRTTQKAIESIVKYVYSGKMNLSTAGTCGRGLARPGHRYTRLQLMATIKNQE